MTRWDILRQKLYGRTLHDQRENAEDRSWSQPRGKGTLAAKGKDGIARDQDAARSLNELGYPNSLGAETHDGRGILFKPIPRRELLQKVAVYGAVAGAGALAMRLLPDTGATPGAAQGGTTLSGTDIEAKRIGEVRYATEFDASPHSGTVGDPFHSAAIVAAMADLPNSVGAVSMAAVHWNVATMIAFPVNAPVRLMGMGADATFLTYNGNDFAVDLQGTGNGSALPYASSVHDSVVDGFTIIGSSSGQGGLRINRTFHVVAERLRIYGFSKTGSPFGSGVFMTACFYTTLRKIQTWNPSGSHLFYGLQMSNVQNATPPYFNLIAESSFHECDRGMELQGNGNTIWMTAFEICDNFGLTSSSGEKNLIEACWFEGISGNVACRIGTTGNWVLGYIVRGNRFSSGLTIGGCEVHGHKCKIEGNEFKSGAPYELIEGAMSEKNLFLGNYDGNGVALLPNTLLAGSATKVHNPGDPIGVIANPLDNTNNTIGLQGNTTTITSAKVYACHGAALDVYLDGGTVSAVAINGTSVVYNSSGISYHLEPGDTLTITHTGAPTMVVVGE